MKKIVLIVCLLVLIGCDQSVSPLNKRSHTTDEVTVLKIKQKDSLVNVYGDVDLSKVITILSGEEVVAVKKVFMTNESITSYKVELKYGTIAYVYADDFYIIDRLTEDYDSYLTPKINLADIVLGEAVSSDRFIDSYMTYDLYVNGRVIEEPFVFIEGLRYELYVSTHDSYDVQYMSTTEILDTEVDRIYCKVREEKDVESKEITRFLNYSDYKNRVVSCEISYKNGQIETWYKIQLDDGNIGYSNDKLYQVNDIDKLMVVTNTETIEIDNSNFNIFKSMPSVIRVHSQTRDELHLIDLASNSHISYLGKSKYFEDNIFVVDHYSPGDEFIRKLSLVMYMHGKLTEVATADNNYKAFSNIEKHYLNTINFGAHFNKDFYWPLTEHNDYVRRGSFKLSPSGYHLVYKENSDYIEPLLEDVVLYKNLTVTSETIGSFDSIDISSSLNEKKIDIKNDKIVCWFKIVTNDGREGYAYRPLFDYELEFLNVVGYGFRLSDGSEYNYLDFELYHKNEFYKLTNDLAGIGRYTFLINRGYIEYNTSIDTMDYDLDHKKMVTDYGFLSDKEMIVSKYQGDYHNVIDESDLTIYKQTHEGYKAYWNMTIKSGKSGDFIWIDDNTISFFIIESNFVYGKKEYPSILRRVNKQWLLESDYTDYEMNRNDTK